MMVGFVLGGARSGLGLKRPRAYGTVERSRSRWGNQSPRWRWNARSVKLSANENAAEEKDTQILKHVADNVKKGDKSKYIKQFLVWVVGAAITAVGVFLVDGGARAEEFVAGYIVEQSLSIDNLFVFLLIFDYFKVPPAGQEKVLKWGIYGAMIMRGVMIVTGETLINAFDFMTLILGGLLFYSSIKILLSYGEEEKDLDKNNIVKLSKKLIKTVDYYDGANFFTEVRDSVTGTVKRCATPLLICLFVVEISDVIFALDSVPAVLGISRDAKVIYLSNILAIGGLRSLFFILESLIGSLRYLPQSLAVVLAFVGAKLCAGFWDYEISTTVSLAIVLVLLGVGVIASLLNPEKKPEASP